MLAAALESVGVSKLTLAISLKEIIQSKETSARDKLTAIKQIATVMGEKVDGNGGLSVNIAATPKSLVMVGFEDDALSRMLKGKKQLELPAPEPKDDSE